MPQTTLNVRIDAELKKQFDSLCSEIGMNMSTAVSIFAKKAVRERRIPFDLTADPQTELFTSQPDTSRRIGIAKGRFQIPQDFAKWDQEVLELFEDSGDGDNI